MFTSDLYTEVPFVRLDNPDPVPRGVPVTRFRSHSFGGEMHYILVPSMLGPVLREEADLIHTHSFGYFQTNVGALRRRLRKQPLVITTHFHPRWSMWGGYRRKQLRNVYDRLFARLTLKSADIIICHTRNEQAMLSEYSISEDKVRIIPAGVDFKRFETIPSPEPFRDLYNISGPIVLYAGRLASNKGLTHLVEAIPRVLSEFRDASFVLIGEDEGERRGLERRVEELGIAENVLFCGHINDDGVFKSAFAACDVLVLPSEYEAFGLVLLEAMACEKPCVATRVGGVPEVVEDDGTGLLVEYGDPGALAAAITDLLGDKGRRQAMGRAGRERVKNNFTWSKVVDQLEEVYKGLV